MKNFVFLLLALFALSNYSISATTINPIIDDLSYFKIMGQAPSSNSEERERIACHLLFVEFLLRCQDVSHLSPEKKRKRRAMLDDLHEYSLRGTFPQNHDYPEQRKPCFIDEHGTVCAVGYLVEQSVGLAAAEQINEEYKYAEVYEMDLNQIENWAESNGLTLIECALIQPSYGWQGRTEKNISFSPLLSWRPAPLLLWGAEVMYRSFSHPRGSASRFAAIGAEYQNLKSGDFSAALHLEYGISKAELIIPYLGLNPEIYSMGGRGGFNLEPQLGIHSNIPLGKIGVSADLSYGYHFRLLNPENYTPIRHDITLAIGFNVLLKKTQSNGFF